MALRPSGIASDLSATNAGLGARIELNPAAVISLVEIGVSMNGAPNSTLVPVEFDITRASVAATGGTGGTVVKMRKDLTAALGTACTVENTTAGTLTDTLHRFFVPVVSGMIWVAAPGREPDVQAAEFMAVNSIAALGASINAAVYMVWEE